MVIALHSILYDDWRHLYFIYPSFVLMGIFVLNKLAYGKYKRLVFAACIAQISYVGYFMVRNHPYQQVYFNALVSHKDQYLRKHYDLDYWGVSFKQGLQYLASTDTAATITICDQFIARVITDNFVMLKPKDRNRFRIVDYDNHPDYFVTNFRYHPDNYNFPKIVYEIKVLNSTILCIYKMK